MQISKHSAESELEIVESVSGLRLFAITIRSEGYEM